tara:strand:- start:2 stop:376 length:375 start_codon:yes stop_codon:yes gene_type:complete
VFHVVHKVCSLFLFFKTYFESLPISLKFQNRSQFQKIESLNSFANKRLQGTEKKMFFTRDFSKNCSGISSLNTFKKVELRANFLVMFGICPSVMRKYTLEKQKSSTQFVELFYQVIHYIILPLP